MFTLIIHVYAFIDFNCFKDILSKIHVYFIKCPYSDNLCIHIVRPYPQDVVPDRRPTKVYMEVGEAVPDSHQTVLLDLRASVGTVLG